ncbi:nucleoside hydrolase [Agromyces sp. Marseille-Q5079]|uniref:nucleoside hydrolase n=1 Tax=Agromyces sp. Marseille-Q5079 TaxID=3439059 RepID=UPI003D9CA6B1
MSIPVIVDCDPGHDDALALWLAAGHPSLDLLAVTTVGGNVPLEHTSRNARIVLSVAGVEGVPVAAGAAGPLARELVTAEWIHGENGLGGPELPEPTIPLDPRTATDVMAQTLEASPEPVAIIATGPITNVAVLLRDRPELAPRIREIVWMGGSTERGNATPYAEFNALVDPEALALVLASGIRFTMVGLNVTHRALVTPTVRSALAAAGTRTAAFGDELLEFFCRTNDEVFGMPDGPLHDPVAVAVLADPGCVTLRHTRLDVELVGTETLGATSVDFDGMLGREPNAWVAVDLDVERFWAGVVDAVSRLA